jgi:hypothetical protein
MLQGADADYRRIGLPDTSKISNKAKVKGKSEEPREEKRYR